LKLLYGWCVLPSGLALIRVGVRVAGFYGYLYTGRLVKSLLIRAYSQLEDWFKPSKGPVPKLIHITPLYKSRGDKVECIYSYADCKSSRKLIKCVESPTIIELNGDYYFYIGLYESGIKGLDIVSKLLNYVECFEFIKQRVCVEIESIEVVNPLIPAGEIARRVIESKGVKVVFSSPVLLRDPLKTRRRQKTFIPSPMNVFAVPIYTKLYLAGGIKKSVYRRELLRVHRLFNETYTMFKTARVKWIYYTDKPIPALVGYVNYRLDIDYLKHLEEQGINVEDWLGNIVAYAMTLGVGTGRATGFGHVEIKPIQAST